MPDLAVWTADDAPVLLLNAADPFLTLMTSSDRGDPRDDDERQWITNQSLHEGEPALPLALDLSAGVLVFFDAYEPRATRLRLDVAPGEYFVVPVHSGQRLHYLSIVERALLHKWSEA